MTPQMLRPALAPLLGLFTVCIGYGFLSSLTTLRLDAGGESPTMVGLVSSAYFLGLALGAVLNDRVIVRVGHIRAYSSFASLIAVTALMQALFHDPWVWLVLRLVSGWATVGVFLVIESWLLLAAEPKTRGRILALYMVALYGSSVLGQALLGQMDALGEAAPFILAGMLASLSVLPVVMIPQTSPLVEKVEPLLPHHMLRVTPTGVVGCFGSGITIAAVYTLLPLYLQRTGLDMHQVGQAMAATILGAMLLQYPVGRWSDRQDRRIVLVALSAVCTALSVAFIVLEPSRGLSLLLLFLLGGAIFTIYPVSVSLAADRAPPGALVPMIQGLLVINSVGSAVSPLAISAVMKRTGEGGLFWSFIVISGLLLGFFLWRSVKRASPPHVAPFEPAATMSPLGAELRVSEDLAEGNHEQEQIEELLGEVPGVEVDVSRTTSG